MQLNIKKTSIKKIIYLNLIVIVLAASGIGTASVILFNGSEIYPSVSIGEIQVGQLSKANAIVKVNAYFETRKELPLVILSIEGEKFALYAADIDAQYNVSHLVDQAFLVAREGSPLKRMRERYLVMQQGKTVPLQLQYNHEKLAAFVQKLAELHRRSAINASIQYVNGRFEVSEHQIGTELSPDKVLALISENLQREWGHVISLRLEQITPHILTSDLQPITKEWTSYVTEFNLNDKNRTANIMLAANAINGTIIKPGEIFSFNKIVGPRLREKGYKDAPVLIQGKLVLDAGGGVCQVTSTLYNTVLLANLEIIERTSHFRPPAYVPLGLDATVADNALDFSFKNNSPSTIYITSEISNNQLQVRIFGAELKTRPQVQILTVNREVLDAKTVIKQDPELPLGQQVVEQEEQKGHRITALRLVSEDDREVKREVLSHDEYLPVDKIIKVGTKITPTANVVPDVK